MLLSSRTMRRIALALVVSSCTVGESGIIPPDSGAQPDGGAPPPPQAQPQLTITATTTPKGGTYAPNNVVAVWIEKADGTAVKTIQHWGSETYSVYLRAWKAKVGAENTDAVSGATRINHVNPLSINWKFKDKNQMLVPDGTYTIRMELADGNSGTPEQNNQGTFTVVKGPQPQTQTGLANGGFTNVTIQFKP